MKARKNPADYFDVDQIKWYRTVSLHKKLEFLEESSRFFNRMVSAKTKKIAQQLKQQGF